MHAECDADPACVGYALRECASGTCESGNICLFEPDEPPKAGEYLGHKVCLKDPKPAAECASLAGRQEIRLHNPPLRGCYQLAASDNCELWGSTGIGDFSFWTRHHRCTSTSGATAAAGVLRTIGEAHGASRTRVVILSFCLPLHHSEYSVSVYDGRSVGGRHQRNSFALA